jgi:hypothetical protein
MSVILSCGHREDDFDRHYNIMTKEWSRENTKAISYKTVCLHCYEQSEMHGEVLYTDEEAMQWIKE